MKLTSNNLKPVWDKVNDQAYWHVSFIVDMQVKEHLHLYSQVYEHVYWQVRNQVYGQVYWHVKNETIHN